MFSGTNEILKIENAATLLADFGGSLAGFASGDTVELVGLSGLTGTYDNETLTLSQGSTVEGALSFTESEALDSNLGSDGFTVTSTGGNTFITTSATNDTLKAVTPGTTVDWGTAATWSNGVPVAGSVAEIALNTTEIDDFLSGIQPSYTLRVDTAETAGSVVFSDPLGTLDIAAPLTLLTPSSGGGGLTTDDGTVEIVSGGYVPVGMMIVGLGLSQIRGLRLDLGFIAFTFLAKFALWPALALGFIWIDSHGPHAFGRVGHQVLLIEALTPMAAVTVVHATLRNIHPDRAAITVALSTLFALVWLPFVLSALS